LIVPGTRLGRYELLRRIATGGMAEVWLARLEGARGFEKRVAIKTLLPDLASNARYRRMLFDEANLVARLHHPNVCTVYELGEEGGRPFIAMEWVDGGSMLDVMRAGGTLDCRVAAHVAANMCAGLHAVHELADADGRPLRVVHRDVSPENVLLSVTGTVKLTDFGVACALDASDSPATDGRIWGKAAYMAPEQAAGEAIDRRSDVFAVGCVLYEATTGIQPFRGDTLLGLLRALLRGTFAPPADVVRDYPGELSDILMRALAPNPADRYADAEQMHMALRRWLASRPLVTASELGALVRTRLESDAFC
jgi:serine/threonine-protein kinase